MPDIRFGHAFFWGYMSLALTFFYDESMPGKFDLLQPNILGILFLACLLAMYAMPVNNFIGMKDVAQSNISLQKDIKEVRMHADSEDSFVLYVPQSDDRCGLSVLPCTPYINDKLYLRNRNQLKEGFKIK